jgi:hypothetical protein
MCESNLSQIGSRASMNFSFSGFHTPSFFISLFSKNGITIPSFSFPSYNFSIKRDELLLSLIFAFATATFVANIISTLHRLFILRVDSHANSTPLRITPDDNASDSQSTSSSKDSNDIVSVTPLDVHIIKLINASKGGMTCKEIYSSVGGNEYTGITKRSINSRIWRMAAKGLLVKNAELPPRWSRSLL